MGYPDLDALIARLRDDDPARLDYELLSFELDGLAQQEESGHAVQRLLRAVAYMQEDPSFATVKKEDRSFHLVLVALTLGLSQEEWVQVTTILGEYSSNPNISIESLRESAGVPAPVADEWQAPVVAAATLAEFKKRYPRHDVERCVADFIQWFRKDQKTSNNPDAAFLTFASRWTV